MSIARPAAGRLVSRCLAATPAISVSSRAAPVPCRRFHNSTPLEARRRPRFKSISAAKMGLRSAEDVEGFAKDHFPEYTAEEKAELRKVYSHEQMAALEAGETAVDPKDLTIQGRLRDDPYRLSYIDDFKDIQPIIDKRPKTKGPPEPNARFMDMDEFTDDLIKWSDRFFPKGMASKTVKDFVQDDLKDVPEHEWPERARTRAERKLKEYILSTDGNIDLNLDKNGPSDTDVLDYFLERSTMTDNGKGSNSALAPALPNQVPGVAGLYKNAIDPLDEGLDDIGDYQELKKRMNISVKGLKSFYVKTILQKTVANQTRLGKVRSASVIAIAGNKNGWLGLGTAKSSEFAIARQKATLAAIGNMRPIPRYENRTIYGNVEAKVSGSVVRLAARPPGFGLRVPSRIFEMCRAAGIQDLAAKMPRSRNPMNTVKATYQALLNQPDPNEIAIGRGKKLVDVRKVYYGGAVY